MKVRRAIMLISLCPKTRTKDGAPGARPSRLSVSGATYSDIISPQGGDHEKIHHFPRRVRLRNGIGRFLRDLSGARARVDVAAAGARADASCEYRSPPDRALQDDDERCARPRGDPPQARARCRDRQRSAPASRQPHVRLRARRQLRGESRRRSAAEPRAGRNVLRAARRAACRLAQRQLDPAGQVSGHSGLRSDQTADRARVRGEHAGFSGLLRQERRSTMPCTSMKNSHSIIAALAALSFAGAAPAQTAGKAPEQLGRVSFANSCASAVQPTFERAVALLHSFWWQEGEKAFREVLQRDPGCAIAAWGIATLLIGNTFGVGPTPAQAQQAKDAIERGRAIVAKTERERNFIEAVAEYYERFDERSPAQRMKSLSDAFEIVAKRFPDDDEAQIFSAIYLTATQSPSERTFASALKAAAILEVQFKKHPDHPGVAHYLIHAYDYPPIAGKGLTAAKRYSEIAPSAPHALHMPSHIFTRVGAWHDSARMNERSAAVAQAGGDSGALRGGARGLEGGGEARAAGKPLPPDGGIHAFRPRAGSRAERRSCRRRARPAGARAHRRSACEGRVLVRRSRSAATGSRGVDRAREGRPRGSAQAHARLGGARGEEREERGQSRAPRPRERAAGRHAFRARQAG